MLPPFEFQTLPVAAPKADDADAVRHKMVELEFWQERLYNTPL